MQPCIKAVQKAGPEASRGHDYQKPLPHGIDTACGTQKSHNSMVQTHSSTVQTKIPVFLEIIFSLI